MRHRRSHVIPLAVICALFLAPGTALLIHFWPWPAAPDLANVIAVLLSLQTLYLMHLAGRDPRKGWYWAVWGQLLWVAYTWASGSWGFLPLNMGLTWVYVRNYRRTYA